MLTFSHRILLITFILFPALFAIAQPPKTSQVAGIVKDSKGRVIAGATINLLTARQSVVATGQTDAQGRFELKSIALGSYELVISSTGFAPHHVAVHLPATENASLEITLSPAELTDEVTVTADFGFVSERNETSQAVNIINEAALEQRAKAVLAQVANEEPGLALQRTSPTIGGIFVRGLTGNKVNVFVDGVRFSTSAMRGGINTFFNLNDAANLRSVEILRGPNSAQFGSDALGGSVQLNSSLALFTASRNEWHGRFSSGFNSADIGYDSNAVVTYGRPDFAVMFNINGHRSNTLRSGGGIDTHVAVTRFLGLPSNIFGARLPDTAFTNYGGRYRMSYQFAPTQQLSVHYQRAQQDGGKRYDQTLGGDGNLIADLRNLMLDFFYVRYEKQAVRWFDNVAVTYSYNSQREERVNQGGNGNVNGAITHQYERTTTQGLQALATKNWTNRNVLVVGGEFYRDFVNAPAYTLNPVTQVATISRPRIPGKSSYRNGGLFAQNIFTVIPARLRVVGSVRYSGYAYSSHASDSPLVAGKPLWPDDSLRVNDVTGRGGMVFTAAPGLNFSVNVGRGFRAPHITDLGTLGITGSGFEVAAPDIAGLGGTLGSSADRNAVATGLAVIQLKPESSLSYDFGAHYRHQRLNAGLVFFINDISNNITKQTLLLPQGAIGKTLGDQVITSQLASGAVFVAASTNPVLVRANYDDARIRGFEQTFDLKLTRSLSIGNNFTYIHAADRRTTLAPNIEGGTPAPQGWASLRYQPIGRSFWLEPYVYGAARNKRLSSLDLDDRRTGATRSRTNIQNFFRNGATVRGLVTAGADGKFGTADDILKPTNETLAQVQDRVLGAGVTALPLFTEISGFVTVNFRGGVRFKERHEIIFDLENLLDHNYRGISWGLDAPGRGISVRYSFRY